MTPLKLLFTLGFLALAAGLHAAPRAFELDDNTISLWNFSEGEGDVVHDEGPGGFEMRVWDGPGYVPPTWVEGKFGPALLFTGSSRLDQAGKRPAMELHDAVTVEAWIKIIPQEEKLGQGILQCGDVTANGFRFGVQPTGELLWIVPSEGREIALLSRIKLPLEEWIHVAGTYDGETMKVFVNGELENEREAGGAVLANTGVFISHFSGGNPPAFTGVINGIRVSNVARSNFKVD